MSDYTHISVILDRTGSMQSIRDDVIGGFNSFLEEQRDQEGEATLTLVQFDSQDAYEVLHHFAPLAEIEPLSRATYVPRASTPLLDALGRGINDLEGTLGEMPEEERPEKVLVVVITDGKENASREFTKPDVERMIEERSEAGWQFVFLSADLSSIGEARELGVAANKRLLFEKSGRGSRGTFQSLSARVSDYRSGAADEMAFLDSDRQHPEDPDRETA